MWNLAIPCTTGMPHRPSSSDGHTSIFVSSNPIGLRYRLSKCARRYAASASLSEASVRLPFLPSLTAEGRCGMDSTESRRHWFRLSRHRVRSTGGPCLEAAEAKYPDQFLPPNKSGVRISVQAGRQVKGKEA